MKRFLRKFQRSTQTYLVLTGIGAVTLFAAPIVALCQLFKPAPIKKALNAKQNELVNHVKNKISEVAEKAKDSFESIEDSIDPDASQGWLKAHKKLHRNKTDEEWEAENGKSSNHDC